MMQRLQIEEVAAEHLTQTRNETGDLRLFYMTDVSSHGDSDGNNRVSGRYSVRFTPEVKDPKAAAMQTAEHTKTKLKRKRTLDHYYKVQKQC